MDQRQELWSDQPLVSPLAVLVRLGMIEVNLLNRLWSDVLLEEFKRPNHRQPDVGEPPLIGPLGGVANDERQDVAPQVVALRPPQRARYDEPSISATQVQNDRCDAAIESLPIERPRRRQLLERRLRPLLRRQHLAGNGNAEIGLRIFHTRQ